MGQKGGRPPISTKVKGIIASKLVDAVDKDEKVTAGQILVSIPEEDKVSLRAIQYFIKKLKRIWENRSETQKALDEPWSLGVSAEYNIPPEATKDLLKIKKWCFVVGRKFTSREAQWAARLRGIVDWQDLLSMAAKYAIRERVSEVMGKAPSERDTTDLDIRLMDGFDIIPASFAMNSFPYEERRQYGEASYSSDVDGPASELVKRHLDLDKAQEE